MLLTKPQLSRFWRTWSAIAAENHWGPLESEQQRHAILQRAGFDSLTKVDRAAGFDRVLAELGRLQDDLDRTAELTPSGEDAGHRRRLMWLINQHALAATHHAACSNYVLSIARDKFHLTEGVSTTADLTIHQLTQLLITLNARRRTRNAAVPAEEPF